MSSNVFDITGRVAVITGGTGLLGQQHALAIKGIGGIPVLVDINPGNLDPQGVDFKDRFGKKACLLLSDITKEGSVKETLNQIMYCLGRVDILINNAANNPKMEKTSQVEFSRLENFPLEQWEQDIAVGLTGAFICSQVIGSEMAKRKQGVIVNVASDLSLIAPDQRLYSKPDLSAEEQPVKPVSYSVVKTGLVGLTRYLATYWAADGIRVNAISPGGVYNDQPEEFVERLSRLIPLGRMAEVNEYQAAIQFLCSDASSYMTGTNLVMDGGRSCW